MLVVPRWMQAAFFFKWEKPGFSLITLQQNLESCAASILWKNSMHRVTNLRLSRDIAKIDAHEYRIWINIKYE